MIRPDDPTLPDRIHLRTLVEFGLAPMLKKQPMQILREMLGGEIPPEPVFANLTPEQLERCIQAAQRAMEPAKAPPAPVAPPAEPLRERMALSAAEAAKALGVSTVTLWRLCKRGLIKPSYALRTPRFAVSEIERFLRDTA